MKYSAGGLAAAVLLSCAAPAAAGSASGSAPASAPAVSSLQSQDAQYAAMQGWLAETAVWTQGYEALTTRQVETLAWLLGGSDTLVAKLQNGGAASAQAWAAVWVPEARARLDADLAAYTRLSPQAPPYPSSLPMTPDMRARVEVIGRTSDQVGTMLLAITQASGDYISVVAAAASGRDEDLEQIDPARLGLLAAQLQAEITMAEAGSVNMKGPYLHFSRANVASNQALIIWLDHNKLLLAGRTVDSAGAARSMRAKTAEIRREVASMRAEIEVFARQAASEPGFNDSPLGRLFTEVASSLKASADNEMLMAGAVDQLAEAILSSDETAEEAAVAKIEAVAGRRLEVDAARRDLIARNGG